MSPITVRALRTGSRGRFLDEVARSTKISSALAHHSIAAVAGSKEARLDKRDAVFVVEALYASIRLGEGAG
jgi:hypothetical protein